MTMGRKSHIRQAVLIASNRVMMLGLKVTLQLSRTNFMVFGTTKPNTSSKLIMAWKRDVNIGERFRPSGLTTFGAPSSNVFEVTQIRVEGFVTPHAYLVNITKPSDQRLISVDALRDENLYQTVQEPDE